MDNEMTTIKVRKSTVKLLKGVSSYRCRRESMEQVILELIDAYTKGLTDGTK